MTFFSLIALALGMIAATDAAVPRPAFAAISIQQRASRRHVRATAVRIERDRSTARPRFFSTPVRRLLAPLTGAASPRAPASRC